MQWSKDHAADTRHDPHIGRIERRLGSDVRGDPNRWHVDGGGKDPPHQLSRAQSSLPGPPDVCLPQTQCPHPDADRQQDSHCIHQQKRRDTFSEPVRPSNTGVGVVSESGDHNKSRTHSQQGESRGRFGVQERDRVQRLDAPPGHLQGTGSQVGQIRHGPVCGKTQCTVTQVFHLPSRSTGGSCRCTEPAMDQPVPICLPTVHSSGQGSAENLEREGPPGCPNSSSVAKPALVSSAPGERIGPTSSSPTAPGPPDRPGGREPQPDRGQSSLASRLESFWAGISEGELSERALGLIEASWRPGTEKSYSSAWRQWWGWCSERQISPFPESITPVVEFIAHKFEEGKQCSTLNSYRSALPATIPPIEGNPVGQHPLVCRALQGSFNRRPLKPKYTTTWDVGLVVTFLQVKMADNQSLNLKQISLKSATLLALANAARASDLVALDVQFTQRTAEGVIFRIPGLTKTRRSGPPRSLFIASFEDKRVCPVHTLECYLSRTEQLRKTSSGKHQLFLGLKKPHNPVTSATIVRWVKEVLSLAGVDIMAFSSHSTRAASASAARNRGVSVKDIMDAAGWTRQSTFETYYNKLLPSEFTQAVLGRKKGTSLNNTLSYTQPCHDVELEISQGSLDLM